MATIAEVIRELNTALAREYSFTGADGRDDHSAGTVEFSIRVWQHRMTWTVSAEVLEEEASPLPLVAEVMHYVRQQVPASARRDRLAPTPSMTGLVVPYRGQAYLGSRRSAVEHQWTAPPPPMAPATLKQVAERVVEKAELKTFAKVRKRRLTICKSHTFIKVD